MKSPSKTTTPGKTDRPPPPLARTESERVLTDFEQALICASEAFYRFAGVVLGPVGAKHKLTGHENVIFQQLLFTPNPRSVSELSRFSNRDDISNIQYSLRKLTAAGLIEKVPGSTNRDTRYRPTQAGRQLTEEIVANRRELLISPSSGITDVQAQLKAATDAMSLLTGLYDHASRMLTGRQ
ncbi:winged helix DNA-binding protein [Phenylobacterium sp.]|uniref:winged helix DNA-binding protein n=1 Tax=Phenylobacterium sp. TaxID=1871053 RepID=UPI002FCBD8BC